MKKNEFLFHQIQNDSGRSLEFDGLKPGFVLSVDKIVAKLASSFRDPLTITAIGVPDLNKIALRYEQMRGLDQRPPDGEPVPSSFDLMVRKAVEESLNLKLPGRRYALEILSEQGVTAVFIEPVKGVPIRTEDVAYNAAECDGKKLRDFELLRILYFTRMQPEAGVKKMPVVMDNHTFYLDVRASLEAGKFKIDVGDLPGDITHLSGAPRSYKLGDNVDKNVIFRRETPDETQIYGQHVGAILRAAVAYWWVMEQEPELIKKEARLYEVENRLRRSLAKGKQGISPGYVPGISPVNIVNIDPERLRKLLYQEAARGVTAHKNTGGYTIPDLVLVQGHGIVAPYARCSIEDVRKAATEILQTKGFDNLEIRELVNAHGNPQTKLRYLSPVNVARVIG